MRKVSSILERNRKASRNGRKAEVIAERILRLHINTKTTIDIPDDDCEIGEIKSCQEYINNGTRFGRITIEEKQIEILKKQNKKLLVVVFYENGGYLIFTVKAKDIPEVRQISWASLLEYRDEILRNTAN